MNFLSTVLAAVEFDISQQNTADKTGSVLNVYTIPGLIQFAITAIVVVAGLIFFFMLIIGGLKWVMSGGDKAQTESARSQITAALIGLVIVFSAWAIVALVQQLFGFNILNLSLPSVLG